MKKPKTPLKVELIPIYISQEEFVEKKEEVQNLIARILIDYHKKKITKKNAGSIPTTI
ncbi:hypothetical protein [Bdellovibrio sp. HCB-162]|uniref:hypothetical protein n=1 Tax=Bdellovibrio sp. HCB-162 TaxID=3394234 RepID=UPI0039BC42E8